MAPEVNEPTPWLALLLLTALALALRAFHLNDVLWYDEIRTLQDSVRAPLWQIVTVYPGEHQHTFYSILAHLSIAAFGDHAWTLRLPSMLFGALTVPMLFLFAREFVSRAEALLASLLLVVSYHHIWFSQSARGYAILAFLTLASSWLLMRGLRRGRLSDFIWYAIVSALGIYTHVTMVFLVASHALLCVLPLGLPGLDAARRERWKLPMIGFALAGLFALLLYAPFMLQAKERLVTKPSPVRAATSRWALAELARGLEIGLGSATAVLVGAALLATGAWSYLKQSRFILGLFLLPGVMTVGAAVVLHRPVRPRFALFAIGFGLLIVVRGAMELGRALQRRPEGERQALPPITLLLVLTATALSAVSLRELYRYPKQDFASALQFIESQRTALEPVLTAGPATYPYHTYFQRPTWQGIRSLDELQRARTAGQRVFVVYTLASYIEGDAPELMRVLRSQCTLEQSFRGTLGGGDVTVCALPPVTAAP